MQPYIERRMRHMGKISSFLEKLSAYTSVVDTFVQVKPEILALIWGPIRLLLVWTANDAKFADAITSAMEKIGNSLPQFVELTKTFSDSNKLRNVLALFYRDILDFYVITLAFFNLSRRRQFFESIWPKQKEKIDVVIKNLEQHSDLMRNEVTLQHIRAEYEARTKSLAHFDQAAEFQQLQRFQALKTELSPHLYHDRLDWLVNRSCDGSAKWLFGDKAFIDWLDISNPAARLLWLRGIPGAGKTFLSAAVVEEAKSHHTTLFVFASHMHSSSTTARSILQSLAFQLASQDKDAQAVLVESKARDISTSTKYVSGLLKTLLTGSGPTYIIVDGLDEMEQKERSILLEQLVGMDCCPEMRILFSSRPEDDIANILDTKAIEIHVNKRNSGSIETYIKQRARNWFEDGEFDQEAQKQIERLLVPIAARAKGMFLFARIILDNVELLSDFQEIEQELKVLPLDLNDAYHRIFSRINELPPASRRKARTILGWIGCSPVPMTRCEMEQALLVDLDSRAAPSVTGSVSFVRICGPILEVVDEIPQFVHFTVKEYIFSQQINQSINISEAYYDLAMSTLTYLSSDIVDVTISGEQVRENILAGKYRLFWFAMSQWIALTMRCAEESKNLSTYPNLQALLLWLALKLKNDRFEKQTNVQEVAFQDFELGCPQISQIIDGVLQFRRDEMQIEWNYTNGSTWTNFDPSILSTIAVRIYDQLEKLLCDEKRHGETCHCAMLRKHYGGSIFKCIYPSCRFNREGFSTRRMCKDHVEIHSRPWKCSELSCLYATIGFTTRGARNNHLQKEHQSLTLLEPIKLPPGQFNRDDLQILLYELTKARNIDRLQQAVSKIPKTDQRTREGVSSPARQLAAMMGSLPMVKILTPFDDKWNPFSDSSQLCKAMMKSENVDLFHWVLNSLRSSEDIETYHSLASDAFVTGSPDMYAEWEDFLLDPVCTLRGKTHNLDSLSHEQPDGFRLAMTLIPQSNKRHVLFSAAAFKSANKSAIYEERVMQTWKRLIEVLDNGPLSPRFLGWSLSRLAILSKPSIKLGAELLRLGAPVDFPRGKAGVIIDKSNIRLHRQAKLYEEERRPYRRAHRGLTALHHATRQTSEEAAQFVRFLLEQGANPDYAYAGMKPEHEKGAALMQKWLGETWDELVERTRQVRLERMDLQEIEGHEEEEDGAPKAKSRKRAKRKRTA
ncbi:hypothetical protein HD806DRAFT_295960 [Xylariaceae sp. AK1471]|nr:hypothetical protein HD806DRAFT_295960 [Xylariaceae sp. AK1471]